MEQERFWRPQQQICYINTAQTFFILSSNLWLFSVGWGGCRGGTSGSGSVTHFQQSGGAGGTATRRWPVLFIWSLRVEMKEDCILQPFFFLHSAEISLKSRPRRHLRSLSQTRRTCNIKPGIFDSREVVSWVGFHIEGICLGKEACGGVTAAAQSAWCKRLFSEDVCVCVCVMTKEVTGGSGGCSRVLFSSQDVCSVARTALNMFSLCTWHVAIRVMSALFAVTHGRPGARTLVCLPSLTVPKTHTYTQTRTQDWSWRYTRFYVHLCPAASCFRCSFGRGQKWTLCKVPG